MKSAIFITLGILAMGCDQNKPTQTATEVEANRPTASAPATSPNAPANAPGPVNAPASANAPADNTDRNERDRSGAALTPGDQGGSDADRTVTQRVRQGVVDDDKLSTTAKNVKIITVDGVVTLRGPVKSAGEKTAIASIAQRVSGVKRVDNQLETVTN